MTSTCPSPAARIKRSYAVDRDRGMRRCGQTAVGAGFEEQLAQAAFPRRRQPASAG